jgi:hypothetical protein
MKQVFMIICGMILATSNLHSEPQPQADVNLRITDYLLMRGSDFEYNGIFSITNTGEVAFTVVTGGEWLCETVRFYQESTDVEWQRKEDEFGKGKERKQRERAMTMGIYNWSLEKGSPRKTLQPGESVSFTCENIAFILPFSTQGDTRKAEMYLGNDTWVSVHIMPTLGSIRSVSGKSGNFFCIQEGTNQYLHVKVGESLKRASEIKLDSKPEKEGEDTVTFELPDGTKKKITSMEARQLETKN